MSNTNDEITYVTSYEKGPDPIKCTKARSEDRGVTEKLWLNMPDGREALFKFTQFKEDGTHTNAHFAEKFVSELTNLTSAKCCEIEIAENEGRIGCLSYNFLLQKQQLINKFVEQGRSDLIPEVERGARQELVDGNALIQNIAPNFDMRDSKNKTKYTLKLIENSFNEIAPDPETAKGLFKNFLKEFLIDSMIMHYDRNPSNLAVLVTRFQNEFIVESAPGFDNGTCLGFSMPKDAIKNILEKENGIVDFSNGVKSKIGWEKEYINYNDMMDSVLNNYYDDAKDFIEEIEQKVTKEAVENIFAQKHYNGLGNEYKEFATKVITYNKDRLVEKYHYQTYKRELQNKMEQGTLANIIDSGDILKLLPEFSNCVDVSQRGQYHKFTVDKYAKKCIENISSIDELCEKNHIPGLNLTKDEKEILTWTVLLHDLGKKQVQKEEISEDGSIKDTFYNHPKATLPLANNVMSKMGFDKEKAQRISRIISYHDRYQIKTKEAIRHFIFGKENEKGNENGIGKENLNIFMAFRLSEIEAQREDSPTREENINELRELPNVMNEILNDKPMYDKESLKKLSMNGYDIIKMGIEGKEIGKVLEKVCEIQEQFPNFKKSEILDYLKNQGYGTNGYEIDFDPRTIKKDIEKCRVSGFNFRDQEDGLMTRVIALNGKNSEYIAKRILDNNHNIGNVWMISAEKGLEDVNILKVNRDESVNQQIHIPDEKVEQIIESGTIGGDTILDKNLAQRLKKVHSEQRGKVVINMLSERPNGFKNFVQDALEVEMADKNKENVI